MPEPLELLGHPASGRQPHGKPAIPLGRGRGALGRILVAKRTHHKEWSQAPDSPSTYRSWESGQGRRSALIPCGHN